MPLPEGLLNPIPGDNPSGKNLRYDAVYDRIREARREEAILPQGEWSREVKKPDYALVIKLTTGALATASKDLQLAAWLTEALLARDHIEGLCEGINLLRGLLERFWDTLYPEIEDGDVEFRASPLAWLGSKLDVVVYRLPLTKNKLNFLIYQESRRVGYDGDCNGSNDAKIAAHDAAIDEQKCTAEEFDEAVRATGDAYYVKLSGTLIKTLESLQSLETLSDIRFGREAPGFANLRTSLENLQQVVRRYHQPAAPQIELNNATETDTAHETLEIAEENVGRSAAPVFNNRVVGNEPADQDDAMQRLISVAQFLRRENPRNPVSYLLLRAMRWGEIRGSGGLEAGLLEAPPTEKRTQLKKLALEGNWPALLQGVEEVMALSCGTGWLDVQRYAVRACESLGSDFGPVAAAIRSELKALLHDCPAVVHSSLADDTPAANAETQTWLKECILPAQPEPPSAPEIPRSAVFPNAMVAGVNGQKSPEIIELAMKAALAGRVREAIEMLMREIGQEQTGRGRFQRKTRLAGLLVATKHEAIAYPILAELANEIDRRNLAEWEEAAVIAEPLVLLYRCAQELCHDDAEKQRIYQKLCWIDPSQALTCLG